ncbi:MAG: EAL domain-containing protein [Candidatus Eremiobacteraeota bacterium]|nr:EAL domain-containing protein [Candidatus Eremiobacteraeota bacterium]
MFAPAEHQPASRSSLMEPELRKAVARRRFELHYQPIVNVARGTTVALEALVRWKDPIRGLIFPDDFIDVAEQTGLIVPIGLLILDAACREARRWHDLGFEIPVSVNVSARQLDSKAFLQSVYRALNLSGLPPTSLWLEITETSIMSDVDAIVEMIVALRARGVKIVIDDFGTGYSSLGRLKAFPVDVLKIDRCFVKDLPGREVDRAVIAAILAVAKSCDMTVVGEGVEEFAQLDALQTLGCDLMQGFHFARPLPAASIIFPALSSYQPVA